MLRLVEQLSTPSSAPASLEKITDIVSQHLNCLNLGEKILADLQSISSQHKFIATVSKVDGTLTDSLISSLFSACWDTTTDGYASFISDLDLGKLLIAIYWILA